MTTATDSPEVRRYLGDLRRLLGDAPDRDLVVEGVERHIDDALSGSTDPGRVRAVLDELGDPAAIAAEAAPTAPAPTAPAPTAPTAPAPGFLERRGGAALTVLLLAFGGLVVPVVGWVVGLVLLWMSRGWTVVDKVVGTAGVPILTAAVAAIATAVPLGLQAAGATYVVPAHVLILGSIPLAGILVAVYLLVRFRPAR